MKQVATTDGKKLNGLFRSTNGGLIVDDPLALQKAVSEKERIDKMQSQISSINNTLMELTEIVKLLVKKNG